MSIKEDHPLLAFASRHGDPTIDYLNAYTAINHFETLLGDLREVVNLLSAACLEEQRWHPWFGAEAISYHSVGFVTCLEWHAKSRLADLLKFQLSAPRLFPNLLDNERLPIFSTETIGKKLEKLDKLVDDGIKDSEFFGSHTQQAWETARARFAEYMLAEESFISTAGMLHWRYFDA